MIQERRGLATTSQLLFTPRSALANLQQTLCAPATAPVAPTVDGLAELARKVESERLAIYRKQIGVDGPRALDGKSYSELSLGVI